MTARSKPDGRGGSRAAEWLALAAAPTFAAMAVASELSGAADPICSAAGGSGALTGMTAMYALMAVVHLGPWLRLTGPNRRAHSPHMQGETR